MDPVQETIREPVQETIREPVQETIREPVKETIREPVPVQETVRCEPGGDYAAQENSHHARGLARRRRSPRGIDVAVLRI